MSKNDKPKSRELFFLDDISAESPKDVLFARFVGNKGEKPFVSLWLVPSKNSESSYKTKPKSWFNEGMNISSNDITNEDVAAIQSYIVKSIGGATNLDHTSKLELAMFLSVALDDNNEVSKSKTLSEKSLEDLKDLNKDLLDDIYNTKDQDFLKYISDAIIELAVKTTLGDLKSTKADITKKQQALDFLVGLVSNMKDGKGQEILENINKEIQKEITEENSEGKISTHIGKEIKKINSDKNNIDILKSTQQLIADSVAKTQCPLKPLEEKDKSIIKSIKNFFLRKPQDNKSHNNAAKPIKKSKIKFK